MRLLRDKKTQLQAAFTLLETVLSIGIITAIALISIPIYYTFQIRNDLNTTAENMAQALRQAQTFSRGVKNDSSWGVKINPTDITIFQGSSYSTRNPVFDEINFFPSTITFSGTDEIVFNKVSGIPNATGSTTFTSINNDNKTVVVNSYGSVSY